MPKITTHRSAKLTKVIKTKKLAVKADAPAKEESTSSPSQPLSVAAKLRYTIAISGAAETGHCSLDAYDNTVKLGHMIAERGYVLITGATRGAPQWAAKAAKEAGGIVIGFSPASSKLHHVKSYRLPIDYHDVIVYTGFDYAGRNILLARAADAVITICGRIGSLNEYTAAFEEKVVQGVLVGSGGIADMLPEIVANSHRGSGKTVFENDPEKLLDEIVKMVAEEHEEIEEIANTWTEKGN